MKKNLLKTLKLAILLGIILIMFGVESESNAQSCVPTIMNPASAVATSVGVYGTARAGGSRSHRGVDIMAPMCSPAQNQPGCTVVPNGGSPLFRTGGYGLYVRYNCGPRVEVRYTHLNGWASGMPVIGRSGNARSTPAHIHYEVIVSPNGSASGGYKVDPQCVWGAHPNPSDCCIGLGGGNSCGLGIGPADMCDDSVLDKLRTNAANRGYGSGLTTGMSITPGISPNSFPPTSPEVDLPGCPETGGQPPQPVEHEHDGGEPLEGPELEVEGADHPLPSPGDVPPPEPPPEDTPSTPGEEADLVITPEDPVGPPRGCSTAVWTAMVNRSVIEARREDVVNKRFIIKPDTVLDYTCFEHNVSKVGEEAGPIFSETEKWANLEVDLIGKTVTVKRRLGTKSLDNALMAVVEAALTNYKNGQFNNDFLADSTPVSGSAGSAYCDVMANVWKAAKCRNFGDFYTFQDLGAGKNLTSSADPREFPNNMKCDF